VRSELLPASVLWQGAWEIPDVRKLKVLHVITTLPRLSGAADNTRYTVNLLDPEQYEVHLASGPAELDSSRVEPHVKVVIIEPLVRRVAPLADPFALWQLFQLIRQEKYDIVHTHNSKAGVLGRLAARLAGVPVTIHTAHNISFAASDSKFSNRLYQTADRACALFTDRIIAVSDENTKRYLKAGVGKASQYVTIYSGIDLARFVDLPDRLESRAQLAINDSDFLVAWIGRFNRQKDPITFVRAASIIASHFHNVRFIMAGEDPLGESLEADVRGLIKELRMTSSISVLGYRPDVDRLLVASDLVLHTSLYEGLARSVIEAMLAGVPVVATGVDGVREAVVPGIRGGLLANPQDPRGLAEAVGSLIENPGLARRLASEGQSWARQRFDVGDMVSAIHELYQELWANYVEPRTPTQPYTRVSAGN
jgi:glycosyltransferase involved in cell wall biosynthesis